VRSFPRNPTASSIIFQFATNTALVKCRQFSVLGVIRGTWEAFALGEIFGQGCKEPLAIFRNGDVNSVEMHKKAANARLKEYDAHDMS
jgi:hypothetical protein